jgi:hypothetical protein
MSEVVEHLPSKYKALTSNPSARGKKKVQEFLGIVSFPITF